MPTFTHVFYALSILIPVMYFARDKFSYKLAAIFLVNNIYGPDLVFLFNFIETGVHSIIGFIIASIPLGLVFSYVSRFSIEKGAGKFPLRIVDEGIRQVNWVNAFCATAAGGISHFFMDQFFHEHFSMILLPNVAIHIDDMFAWSDFAGRFYHTMNPIMVVGEFIVVAVLLLSPFYLKRGVKESLIVYGGATVLSLILMLLVSTEVYGGEREFAGIFCCTVYIFIPLFLLFYAARNINEKPVTEPDKPKLPAKTRLQIMAAVGTLLGIVMLGYGLVVLLMTDMIVDLIGGLMVATPAQLQVLAVYYGFFGILLTVGSIGLFFRSNVCRYLAAIGAGYFIIFGFPIGIAAFLFENDIKPLFQKGGESAAESAPPVDS